MTSDVGVHARIVVDGQTLLDHDLHQWENTPPQALAELVKPGSNPPPWMKATLLVLADATLSFKSVNITTTSKPAGWQMRVHYPE